MDSLVHAGIGPLAQAIAGATASEDQLRAAKAFAEAQFDLQRIRDTRLAATPVALEEMLDPRVMSGLAALDRYERLALGRRKLAVRQFEGLDRKESPCK
jgi:cytosine/adenosine deaminase-related metal-dependent hydrolase